MLFQITHRDDALPLAHVAIAVEGPGWANPDNVALQVANAMIGHYDCTYGGGMVSAAGSWGPVSGKRAWDGGPDPVGRVATVRVAADPLRPQHLSSPLASVAVANKLCQSFQSFNICYGDTGLLGAHFVCDGMSIDDMVFFLQGQW